MSSDLQEPEPQETPLSWLQRIIRRFGGKRQGDVIVAQIGSGAKDIVVGKNIVVIGNITFPYWLLLLMAAAAVAVAGVLYWWSTAPPKLTAGTVRLAVTSLGYQDEDGAITPLLDREAGEILGTKLQTAIGEEAKNFAKVRSDPSYFEVGAYPSLVVKGPTTAAQEQWAAKQAQRVNATLVIYGYIAAAPNDQWRLQLYFYYHDPEIREEPDAVSSGHLLGKAIMMDADPRTYTDRALGEISEELSIRGRALAWIAAGLYEDSIGQWDAAQRFFQGGLANLFDEQGIVGNSEQYADVRSLFHYFIGREALWLHDYELAASEQAKAIQANGEYANAYHALGVIDFDRAQMYFSFANRSIPEHQAGCFDEKAAGSTAADDGEAWQYIDEAKANLGRAIQLAEEDAPQLWSHVASVSHLTLGLVNQLEAQVYLRDGEAQLAAVPLDEARANFETALAGFSAEPPHNKYIGWSRLGLGMTYLIGADLAAAGTSPDGQTRAELLDKAVDEYQACIERKEPGSNSYFNRKVVTCGCEYYKAEAERELEAAVPRGPNFSRIGSLDAQPRSQAFSGLAR